MNSSPEDTCQSTHVSTADRADPKHCGTLHIRIGPMFSSKTTWLNGELTKFADKGFSVLKIIHSDDVRDDVESDDSHGTTHNSSYTALSDKISCVRTDRLESVDGSGFHVIGIDESQFYDDLKVVVRRWVEQEGKHVRVVGLDGDAFKNKFGQILELIPICDDIKKLRADCKICLDQLQQQNFRGNLLSIAGAFTKKLTPSTSQKDVGGASMYIPVCRYHHSH